MNKVAPDFQLNRQKLDIAGFDFDNIIGFKIQNKRMCIFKFAIKKNGGFY